MSMLKMMKKRRLNKGAALVEAALSISVLMFLLFGIIQYGMYQYTKSSLGDITRMAARYAAVHSSSTDINTFCTGNVSTPYSMRWFINQKVPTRASGLRNNYPFYYDDLTINNPQFITPKSSSSYTSQIYIVVTAKVPAVFISTIVPGYSISTIKATSVVTLEPTQ